MFGRGSYVRFFGRGWGVGRNDFFRGLNVCLEGETMSAFWGVGVGGENDLFSRLERFVSAV